MNDDTTPKTAGTGRASSERERATFADAATHPAAKTPMMQQFMAAKEAHPDAIVFFRMGDFYETFFDDAVEAAQILELTLTSRNKKDALPIPMAGVPHHAAQGYIRRLLEVGRKVAVCEQVEDPKKTKGLVRREVVRVVTPGVVLDEQVLDSRRNNFLVAVAPTGADGVDEDAGFALAYVDVSTGERMGTELGSLPRLLDELGRLEPAEVLLEHEAPEALRGALTRLFDRLAISRASAKAGTRGLDAASSMLASYITETQKQGELPLKPLVRYDTAQVMQLGADAVRNLELVRTLAEGRRRGSVLGLVDRCRTAMGSRLLKRWLLYPLLEVQAIRARQEIVEALVGDPLTRGVVRSALESVYDLERLVTRTVASTAGPRDLSALARSLRELPGIAAELRASSAPALVELADTLDEVPEVVAIVERALVDEPPAVLKDGGVIREGFDADLDELLLIAREGKSWFSAYAAELKEATGIASLKIRFNNVFGYFIEVTKANLHLVPDDWLRKQTLANAERYYTPALKEREEKVLGADERRVALEGALFEDTRAQVAEFGARIQATAERVAALDAYAALAELAHTRGYVRPLVDEGYRVEIEGGRHPVIEALLPAGEFVPNDITLDADQAQLVIITGPNMAGKSTVMRQVALIALLAQIGSFVPADRARIGLVDQIFTRVGASDNLARGESTFMVEMKEAASILENATRRSLVILDEIGRGTSTYDGVSIAWSVAEYLHDQLGARTLFATHYHELTELAATRERIVNMSIAVREWQDDIVFLRRLVPGGTNRSYGIQVARLAGLPEAVISRAHTILHNLEESALDRDSRPRIARGGDSSSPWQLSLFAPDPRSPTLDRLAELDPDALTPRQALDVLYDLCSTLKRSS